MVSMRAQLTGSTKYPEHFGFVSIGGLVVSRACIGRANREAKFAGSGIDFGSNEGLLSVVALD